MITVKIPELCRYGVLDILGLGYEDRHCVRQAFTAHQHEFKHIVKRCRIALSGLNDGYIRERSPSSSDFRIDSLASIHSLLPLIVFISPLCPRYLNGCARSQLGKVLVLNLEWTSAIALCIRSSVRSV